MDPISAALIAALSAGVMSGLTEASKSAINAAYARLKALIAQKFGNASDVMHAVEQVECKPDSAGRRATLEEELTTVRAKLDPDLLCMAQKLLELLQAEPEAGRHIQQAMGHSIAQADRGSSASVTTEYQERSREISNG